MNLVELKIIVNTCLIYALYNAKAAIPLINTILTSSDAPLQTGGSLVMTVYSTMRGGIGTLLKPASVFFR